MPGFHKHVHWAQPSPTTSVSTLPSTPGPLTPPQHNFTSPYTYQPLPGEGNVHNMLCETTKLRWDLTLEPTLNPAYHDAATSPPLPFMIITVLGSDVSIRPGKLPYVTVGDILEGVYRFLREPLSTDRFASLHPEAQARVTDAFCSRYRRMRKHSHNMGELEKSKGLKKIDLLRGRTLFTGLRSTQGQDVWELTTVFPST